MHLNHDFSVVVVVQKMQSWVNTIFLYKLSNAFKKKKLFVLSYSYEIDEVLLIL